MFLLAAVAAVAGWLAWVSYTEAVAYQDLKARLTGEYEFERQIDRLGKRWLSELSLGVFDDYDRDRQRIAELRDLAEHSRTAAFRHFYAFVGVALAGGLLAWLVCRRRSVAITAALLVSLVALIAGLAAPAMALTASKAFPAVGEVTLYFESRGILATVRDLLGPQGSWLIGVPLLCFSVLIPILKTLTMIVAVLSRGGLGRRLMTLVHRVGKWSMADVCVVGWLLGFMAVGRQEFMQAEIQVGILFFACYAILSIAAAQLLEGRHAALSA
jgi:hypothetical protein